ncbi:folylpolyglutamate synthase [Stenotrophomonas ginsengisoli]|uniref:Dihydrofolate synthase/folylpolyglutamate synthase n=1 Tax=Stenotrophomonas ginsengisoli TaxID=336566 RepID=A0A0R0D5E3_9GAMM|nr:bifunctional tetrahydrofolate synthase/dihydrofolate synthase [Stenotrophomonas ginsengisoli]KRG73658.1 folylpolyglutamate synthase [Stenotrophomonas ginsengisoli]
MSQILPATLDQWLAHIEQQHPQPIAMGLERVREVAGRLGLTKPGKRVVVVAGTNGKGSTVAFIEAIGRAAGWKVGAYTSPHLQRYNERVRIEGADADDAALVEAFAAVEAARGQTALTYFEYGTLAALWLFQRAGLDLAVLEVGMGGRLDAVNIVDGDVAVITSVDLDHQAFLGDEREAIGEEKAGVIRGWKPVVCGEIDPPSSVLRRAYLVGANALRFGSDFFAEVIDDSRWRWRDVSLRLELPMPALVGPVQLANAASAIAALRALDVRVPRAAWAEGIAAARNPGRMEAFEHDGIQLLLDVGHNPHAARAVARTLASRACTGKTHVVLAMLADKDAAGVAQALAEQVNGHWALAGLTGERGRSAGQLAQALQGQALEASCHADVASALQAVLAQAQPGDRVLVTGSFVTVAQVRNALLASG